MNFKLNSKIKLDYQDQIKGYQTKLKGDNGAAKAQKLKI